jgi:hypothetical protein
MTSAVWKYPITHGINEVEVPAGAEFLYVGLDQKSGEICVWALVSIDPNHVKEEVRIYLAGTGEELPFRIQKYIGTATDGIFFWHVFEIKGRVKK